MQLNTLKALADLEKFCDLEGAYIEKNYHVYPSYTVTFKEKEGYDASYIKYIAGAWKAIVYNYPTMDECEINEFSGEDKYGDMHHGLDIMFTQVR